MLTFAQRVVAVQRDLHAPKNQFNKFGGYKYRSAEDILNSVKPLLADKGLLLTITDEIICVANRIYVKAVATLTDAENGTQNVSATAFAREDETKKGMDGAQVTGSASSYARKYALNGLFLIDDARDADATQGTPAAQTMTRADRLKALRASAEKANSREALAAIWNANKDLQGDADFTQIITEIGKKFPR